MSETIELWRDITGYEGLYLVSNLGRIKRLPTGKQWPCRQTHNNIRKLNIKNGYLTVNLSKNNIVKCFFVHRLVASSFVPNPNGYPCVNHKNENKTDNRAENLEWCTQKYNANYGTGIERQKESRAANPNDKLSRALVGIKNSKGVRQLTPDGEIIATFPSLEKASIATGVHISTIIRQCKGLCKTARKYKFEYEQQ